MMIMRLMPARAASRRRVSVLLTQGRGLAFLYIPPALYRRGHSSRTRRFSYIACFGYFYLKYFTCMAASLLG